MIVPNLTSIWCHVVFDVHYRVPNTGWHSAVKALACPAGVSQLFLAQSRDLALPIRESVIPNNRIERKLSRAFSAHEFVRSLVRARTSFSKEQS